MSALGPMSGHAQQEVPSRRAAASAIGFNIGVSVGGYAPTAPYDKLIDLQTREFNLALIGLYWPISEPQRGQFRFEPFLNNLRLARAAGMRTFAHPILWAGSIPAWVRGGGFSRDELLKVMYDRISACLERFVDNIDVFNVVNEAYFQNDIFRDVIGPEYVELAFSFVRQQVPKARLLYNDFFNHRSDGQRLAHTREVVTRLADKGLIDYVGLEMHLGGDGPETKDDVTKTMQSYGLPVFVTEFDVNLRTVTGSRDERFARQARVYRDMLQAALASGVCQDFVVFQVVDQYTVWEQQTSLPGSSPDADPSPFDDDFSPKPAYFAMRDVLRGAAGG
ncbi:MAG: endo-1,4-beta-xylanase [Chloroflexota bacterium]